MVSNSSACTCKRSSFCLSGDKFDFLEEVCSWAGSSECPRTGPFAASTGQLGQADFFLPFALISLCLSNLGNFFFINLFSLSLFRILYSLSCRFLCPLIQPLPCIPASHFGLELVAPITGDGNALPCCAVVLQTTSESLSLMLGSSLWCSSKWGRQFQFFVTWK